jgi:hypothetical protein
LAGPRGSSCTETVSRFDDPPIQREEDRPKGADVDDPRDNVPGELEDRLDTLSATLTDEDVRTTTSPTASGATADEDDVDADDAGADDADGTDDSDGQDADTDDL